MMTRVVTESSPVSSISALPSWDRIGVFASILCAIHCAVTPFIFLIAPLVGSVWAHPASHWGMALFVIPLAGATLVIGYRKHRAKMPGTLGGVGAGILIMGSVLPYVETQPLHLPWFGASADASKVVEGDDVFVWKRGETVDGSALDSAASSEVFHWRKGEGVISSADSCDACCPSIKTDESGNTFLNVPLASIVTTLGGIFMISAHRLNLRCSRKCCESPHCLNASDSK